MTSPKPSDAATEEFWREFLTHGPASERATRRVFRHIPSAPRCRMCAAPFQGLGAPVMRLMGKRQSGANPNMCNSCYTFLADHHGGAEIECTLLFADIRGSTTLAESMSPTAFRAVLDRFYDVAAKVVFDHDGTVDKFVGDELMANFFPLLSGDRYAVQGVEAAQALLRATGHADPGGPWVPVGAAVHTGLAWVGAVGAGTHTDITAVGDAVNTTARLATLAQAGEVLVTKDAATAAGLDPAFEQRAVELRGKQDVTHVVTLRVTPQGAGAVG